MDLNNWKQALDYWCPSGIPYDVLEESIVHSSNEKSERFLYLAASFFSFVRHFELSGGLPLYTRSQTPVPGSPFPDPSSRH